MTKSLKPVSWSASPSSVHVLPRSCEAKAVSPTVSFSTPRKMTRIRPLHRVKGYKSVIGFAESRDLMPIVSSSFWLLP